VVRFEGRIEEGKTGCGGVERCPFKTAPWEAEEGGLGGSMAWRDVWKEGDGGHGPDRPWLGRGARGRHGAV
jgi:hypothetical protein